MKNIAGAELARRIESGAIRREDVVSHAFDRIEKLDPEIQAFVSTLHREQATSLATHARGPLAGLPVGVKDIFDTANLPTSYGSPVYAGFKPAADAAIVSLIRRAGGLVLGKTVTCEFAYMSPTPTKNPADTRRTAGGSSSGSAAAVAAGMVPFAIGTQTGGSTIRPASFCGIAGYKPTFDMFPTPGMKCFSWSLDTVGLFAATVADVAWFAETLIGRPLTPAPSDMRKGLHELVVGVPSFYPWDAPSASAATAVEQACKAIEAHGGTVRPINLPSWMDELPRAHAMLQQYEASQSLAFEFDMHAAKLSPMLTAFLQGARQVTTTQYDSVRQLVADAKQVIGDVFDGVDVLLTPSAPGEAPMGFSTTGDPSFNKAWTLLGTPCVSVPGLTGEARCPIGLQVIAAPWQDRQCLTAAALVETVLDSRFRPAFFPLPEHMQHFQ